MFMNQIVALIVFMKSLALSLWTDSFFFFFLLVGIIDFFVEKDLSSSETQTEVV